MGHRCQGGERDETWIESATRFRSRELLVVAGMRPGFGRSSRRVQRRRQTATNPERSFSGILSHGRIVDKAGIESQETESRPPTLFDIHLARLSAEKLAVTRSGCGRQSSSHFDNCLNLMGSLSPQEIYAPTCVTLTRANRTPCQSWLRADYGCSGEVAKGTALNVILGRYGLKCHYRKETSDDRVYLSEILIRVWHFNGGYIHLPISSS